MPPFLPKRRRSPTPPPSISTRKPPTKKARLADALDAAPDLARTRTFSLGSDSSTDSSLSNVDSDQFEDVDMNSNAKHSEPRDARVGALRESNEDENEDEDDVEWEDAAATHSITLNDSSHVQTQPLANGPIQLTFRKDDDEPEYATAASGAKKGPTRREKQARIHAHQMHVQFLLFHNALRNAWLEDKTVQQTLIKQLPPQILKEVEKCKRASGILPPEPAPPPATQRGKKRKKTRAGDGRNQRDWGGNSQRLEEGRPDMSHGDPVISLMRVLSAYWKKRFAITVPGLRKRGYGTKQGLKREILSFRNEEHDPEKHGEKIQDIEAFRKIANICEGSRDVGAQLFTALIRGLGFEARLVASLQPAGYGWTKAEQMVPKKFSKTADAVVGDPAEDSKSTPNHTGKQIRKKAVSQVATIVLDTDSDNDETSIKDEDSVIDMTPSMPKQRGPKYDRDLAFPIYWTEVISSITNKVLPVSPLVLENAVASTPEALSAFEPRGAKAEKAHQVMAYIVAHSSDGTAKDVTVRYLRKQLWPGKTKGFRMPLEKVPVYDTRGRLKRYENFDWFKRVMSPYGRSSHMRRAVDDIEESTDLVPAEAEKKDDGTGDTLQSLKASADFVLERFLRREEALRPGAEPVRTFTSGKGDKLKEESVYRRADVERCLTAESWHKEGRRPKIGESAMKLVPVRAVTLTRKREAEEHERVTGEKQMQGLYSWDQTEWIIPEPIRDGIIPKNSYGNMDCFVPSMVPRGAVHIPLKGTVRICKKLEIDFAEAVTGFEFGNKRAVPVCTGVVVAEENEKLVKDAWRIWNEEQRKKEETKMEKLVLDLWKKFVVGLRIRERVAEQYGEELGIDMAPTGLHIDDPIQLDDDDENGKALAAGSGEGGFIHDDNDDNMGGGFLLPHEDEPSQREELVMDETAGDDTRKGWHNDGQDSRLKVHSHETIPAHDQSSPREEAPRVSDSSDRDEQENEDEPMDFAPLKRAVQTRSPAQSDRVTLNERTEPANSLSGSEGKRLDNDSIDDREALVETPDTSSETGNENDDEDEEEEEEVYVPRSTRTRLPRSSMIGKPSIATPTQTPSKAKKTKGDQRKHTSQKSEDISSHKTRRSSRRHTQAPIPSTQSDVEEEQEDDKSHQSLRALKSYDDDDDDDDDNNNSIQESVKESPSPSSPTHTPFKRSESKVKANAVRKSAAKSPYFDRKKGKGKARK